MAESDTGGAGTPETASGMGEVVRQDALKGEAVRQVVGLVIRLVLFAFAIWFAFVPAALPEDSHILTRVGLALLFLIAGALVREVQGLRLHFSIMLSSIQAAKAQAGQARAGMKADPRLAIDTLVGALDSEDADTRATVVGHLQRLTGESFGDDPQAWRDWWATAREQLSPDG